MCSVDQTMFPAEIPPAGNGQLTITSVLLYGSQTVFLKIFGSYMFIVYHTEIIRHEHFKSKTIQIKKKGGLHR